MFQQQCVGLVTPLSGKGPSAQDSIPANARLEFQLQRSRSDIHSPVSFTWHQVGRLVLAGLTRSLRVYWWRLIFLLYCFIYYNYNSRVMNHHNGDRHWCNRTSPTSLQVRNHCETRRWNWLTYLVAWPAPSLMTGQALRVLSPSYASPWRHDMSALFNIPA